MPSIQQRKEDTPRVEAPDGTRGYHHGGLRRSILDAALAALGAGEEELSFRKLAEQAGVARSAPYHHFRDRGELLAVLAGEGFLLLGDCLRRAAEAPMSPAAKVASLCRAYVRFGREHRAHYRVMFLPVVTLPQNVANVHAAAEGCYALLEQALEDATSAQAHGASRDRAHALWAALHGIVTLGQERGPFRHGLPIEREGDFVVALAAMFCSAPWPAQRGDVGGGQAADHRCG